MIRAPSADEPGEKKKVHDRNQREEEEEETGRKKTEQNKTQGQEEKERKQNPSATGGVEWGEGRTR